MECPACTRTRYHVINEDCPICAGEGRLRLGAPALAFYSPGTVARAVALALETLARSITETTTLSANRSRLLAGELHKLEAAGLLHPSKNSPAVPPAPIPQALPAEQIAELATGKQLTLFDIRVSDTGVRSFEYHPDDRPRARGLPVLSAAGHPSAVAMICDPADPFGDTRREANETRTTERNAEVLRSAALDAARMKRRGNNA